jgi:membrane protein implicated in regulation of membrane protease activity
MTTITDFLWNLGAWNWFILAAIMMLLETIIPGVHFMWFGIAAVIMAGAVLLMPMPLAVQLVAFAVLSLLIILIARRFWAPQAMKTDAPGLNERGMQYVGRIVTVAEPITGGRGKVRVGDTVWTAEGPELAEGATAKVTGVNGTALVVAAA